MNLGLCWDEFRMLFTHCYAMFGNKTDVSGCGCAVAEPAVVPVSWGPEQAQGPTRQSPQQAPQQPPSSARPQSHHSRRHLLSQTFRNKKNTYFGHNTTYTGRTPTIFCMRGFVDMRYRSGTAPGPAEP